MTDDDYDPEADARLSYDAAVEELLWRHRPFQPWPFWVATAVLAVGLNIIL